MDTPTPNVNPNQLVRYVIQIDAMNDTDSIGRVRQQLTELKLLVDRIEPGEAEVAVTHPNAPTPEDIRDALGAAGFEVQNITAQTG
ncbi:hypothetical protein SAMN00120144_1051 [Hymenobacter roseosalivarius DSM 11622]|uniref:HMA domain-containing protein n=1 Tax=Hymenobacter roseosalivarius DSM 11622 TaxID=645990 RepID=A0A1W1VY64_9BACT|nr:hypothetical protein [Hymenobacter roseosalivarius]SMB98329.1 hypothetical protein SAMN00120144_1051 [Hymenobacter roseosalivarius DSM 11622]